MADHRYTLGTSRELVIDAAMLEDLPEALEVPGVLKMWASMWVPKAYLDIAQIRLVDR